MGKFQITPIFLACSLGLVVACSLGTSAYATLATGTYVSSGAPSSASDAFTGIDAWTVESAAFLGGVAADAHDTSTANTGSGVSGDIDDGDDASWRLTSSGTSVIAATATFAGPLLTDDSVSLDFDIGTIDPVGRVEVRFLDGAGTAQASLVSYGGISDFQVFDGTNPTGLTTIPVMLAGDGFNIRFKSTGAGDFDLTVDPLGAGATVVHPGFLAGGSGASIEKIQVFNQAAGSHASNSVFFNNLELSVTTAAIPEASSLIAIPFAFCVTGIVVVLRRRNSPAA